MATEFELSDGSKIKSDTDTGQDTKIGLDDSRAYSAIPGQAWDMLKGMGTLGSKYFSGQLLPEIAAELVNNPKGVAVIAGKAAAGGLGALGGGAVAGPPGAALGFGAGTEAFNQLNPDVTLSPDEQRFTPGARIMQNTTLGLLPEAAGLVGQGANAIIPPEIRNADQLSALTPQIATDTQGARAMVANVAKQPSGTAGGSAGLAQDLQESAKAFADSGIVQQIDPKDPKALIKLVGDPGTNSPGLIQETTDKLVTQKEDLIKAADKSAPGVHISNEDLMGTQAFKDYANDEVQLLKTGVKSDSNLQTEFSTYSSNALSPGEKETYKFLLDNPSTPDSLKNLIKDSEKTNPFGRLDPLDAAKRPERTLPDVVDEIRGLDARLRVARAFDDAPSGSAYMNPSMKAKIQGETAALSARREALNEALITKLNQVSPGAGDAVAKLNQQASATITWGDTLQRRADDVAMAGVGSSERSLKSSIEGDASKATTGGITKFITGPIQRGIENVSKFRNANSAAGDLFKEIDAYTRALTGNNLVTRRTGEQAGRFMQKMFGMGGPAGQQLPAILDRSMRTLPTQDQLKQHLDQTTPGAAEQVSKALGDAVDSGDPIAVSKIMGSAIKTFPELQGMYAEPLSLAASEYNGIIADPADKEMLKNKAFMALRSRTDNSIEVAQFIAHLHGDTPFTKVPKSLRFQSPDDTVVSQDLSPFGFSLS